MATPRRRRSNPTSYFVLGLLWLVLATGQWGPSDSAAVTIGFAFLGLANLAVGVAAVRRQRSADQTHTSGG